jgi:hypothetical protein
VEGRVFARKKAQPCHSIVLFYLAAIRGNPRFPIVPTVIAESGWNLLERGLRGLSRIQPAQVRK